MLCECWVVLQCLAKCREEVCQALSLQQEDVELSMGMSGDFEEAVSQTRSFLYEVMTHVLPCTLHSVLMHSVLMLLGLAMAEQVDA